MPRPPLVSFVCNMYRYTIPMYLMDASRVNRLQLAVTKIKNIFQIKDRNFTETELKYISKWINDMSVDIDMIKKAYDVTVTNTQKLSYPYMTTVLQSIVDGTFDKPKSKQAKGGFLNYTERKDLDENDLNMIKKRREYIAKGEA